MAIGLLSVVPRSAGTFFGATGLRCASAGISATRAGASHVLPASVLRRRRMSISPQSLPVLRASQYARIVPFAVTTTPGMRKILYPSWPASKSSVISTRGSAHAVAAHSTIIRNIRSITIRSYPYGSCSQSAGRNARRTARPSGSRPVPLSPVRPFQHVVLRDHRQRHLDHADGAFDDLLPRRNDG